MGHVSLEMVESLSRRADTGAGKVRHHFLDALSVGGQLVASVGAVVTLHSHIDPLWQVGHADAIY